MESVSVVLIPVFIYVYGDAILSCICPVLRCWCVSWLTVKPCRVQQQSQHCRRVCRVLWCGKKILNIALPFWMKWPSCASLRYVVCAKKSSNWGLGHGQPSLLVPVNECGCKSAIRYWGKAIVWKSFAKILVVGID